MQASLRLLDLHSLVGNCADMLRPLADSSGVDISVQVAPDCRAVTDERCLRQIVLNLGSNAVKYAGRGASVVLSAELSAAVRAAVEPVDEKGAAMHSLVLTVADTGAGMSAAQVQRLFQPFDRLGQEAGKMPGSGLGLVITRQLARLLGGEVHLVSTPGQGTTATVCLPTALDRV